VLHARVSLQHWRQIFRHPNPGVCSAVGFASNSDKTALLKEQAKGEQIMDIIIIIIDLQNTLLNAMMGLFSTGD
jgi:hypothetical protein